MEGNKFAQQYGSVGEGNGRPLWHLYPEKSGMVACHLTEVSFKFCSKNYPPVAFK